MLMNAIRLGMALWLAAPLAWSAERSWLERLCEELSPPLRRSNQRLENIAADLTRLPVPSGMSSTPAQCFATNPSLPGGEPHWLEVTLRQPELIDTVVMVPAVYTGFGNAISGFGFPRRFRIEVDAGDGTPPWILVDQNSASMPNPGIFPVSLSLATPRPVKRLRLHATLPWQADSISLLALSELMLLAGNRNVAFGARVDASSYQDAAVSMRRANLVDMCTTLGLPAVAHSGASRGYHSRDEVKVNTPKTLTLTLAASAVLDEIRLIPVTREGMPSYANYGFPRRLRVEAAMEADFSDARTLLLTPPPYGEPPGRNIFIVAGDGQAARYLRITAVALWPHVEFYRFALAEVQAYAGDANVALEAKVSATDPGDEPDWNVAALTDGDAYEQKLVDLPEWFRQIEKRRQLMAEQAQVMRQHNALLHTTQEHLIRGSSGAAALVMVSASLALWRQKRRYRRERERLKERLALDLHDDIGSNLASISLLCNIVTQHPGEAANHLHDFAEIQHIATESADSMRDMVTLLNPKAGSGDWLEMLQRLAERRLPGIDVRLERGGVEIQSGPNLETRREIYLFCKEALANIARHARATVVDFKILLTQEELCLELHDNGIGFDPAKPSAGYGLSNLRQRANQMGAEHAITSSPGKGTRICLRIKQDHRWLNY